MILILGGAGYIGSVLTKHLKDLGENVVVYDNFLYGKEQSDIPSDILDINNLIPAIDRADVVVNLAGLSNDPTADLKPELTWKMNYLANKTISDLLVYSGKRVVFASSCSVYGFGKNTFDETSTPNPVTLYARTKMLSEKYYLRKGMNSAVLRFATVYGMSPNPRLDLVVNTMVASSYFNKEIVVNGGQQWRPLVHVKDVCRAIHMFINSSFKGVVNVGSNEQNYLISDLGREIGNITNIPVKINTESVDSRSYKVNFDIIKKLGFETQYDVKFAVKELYEAFESGVIKNMTDDKLFRIKYLTKHG